MFFEGPIDVFWFLVGWEFWRLVVFAVCVASFLVLYFFGIAYFSTWKFQKKLRGIKEGSLPENAILPEIRGTLPWKLVRDDLLLRLYHLSQERSVTIERLVNESLETTL
jgi:hypothetical protein